MRSTRGAKSVGIVEEEEEEEEKCGGLEPSRERGIYMCLRLTQKPYSGWVFFFLCLVLAFLGGLCLGRSYSLRFFLFYLLNKISNLFSFLSFFFHIENISLPCTQFIRTNDLL